MNLMGKAYQSCESNQKGRKGTKQKKKEEEK